MAQEWVCGIDVGTTAVKVVLLDPRNGRWVQERSDSYPLRSPHPGWAEELPSDWVDSIRQATARLFGREGIDRRRVTGIGISGMVPALVLLDGNYGVLRPSIQQNDGRTDVEIHEVARRLDLPTYFSRAGSMPNQQHVLPRLLWLRAHEPAVWPQVRHIVGSYDYVRGWLTGNYRVEQNWAAESGLYDVLAGQWMTDVLDEFGVPVNWLSDPVGVSDVVGYLDRGPADYLGLPSGTPVVGGTADHVAAALAAGVSAPGDTLIKFGGAGDILYCTDRRAFHPRLYFDFHDIPGLYLLNGCMVASGSLVRWWVDRIGKTEADLSALDRAAATIPAGSDGIVILPYFLGEKTPLLDPTARGIIFGLMLHHGNAHVFRAVLESVVYGFRHHLDVLQEAGYPIHRIVATDGGAKSSLWLQIAADALGHDIVAYPDHPGSALGAALVAAFGLYGTAEGAVVRPRTRSVAYCPNARMKSRYDTGYTLYRELYQRTQTLLPLSRDLAREGDD